MRTRHALAAATTVLLAAAAHAQAPRPDVREAVDVHLPGDVVERWQLVWTAPPTRHCTDPADATTCPCAGFEFADRGFAALVRLRDGREVDRLALDALYRGDGPSQATFPRHALTEADRRAIAEARDEATLERRFAGRPLLSAIVLRDYDGDGVAAEFVLQVDAGPCGHRPSVLIGLGATGRLHALGRAGGRPTPLVLRDPTQWSALLGGRAATLVQWPCGDHGGVDEGAVVVRWARGEPDYTTRTRRCTPPR